MLRSDILWRNGGRLLSVALLGGLALNAGTSPAETLETTGIQGRQSTAQTWLTLEQGWLCRSWNPSQAPGASDSQGIPPVVMDSAASAVPLAMTPQSQRLTRMGAMSAATVAQTASALGASVLGVTAFVRQTRQSVTHCTSQWHISADGRLISDAAAWTPNPTGEWPALTDAVTATAPLRATSPLLAHAAVARQSAKPVSRFVSVLVIHTITPPPAPVVSHATASAAAPTFYTSPGGIGPWTPVPGRPSYGVSDFAGDPNSYEFGVCTWWAWYTRRDEPQLGTLGVATNWISNARARGMSVGYAPAVGATVVFAPGVQGGGGSGHVGHVEQLLGGGWFIISEMNFYWNGGGWGRVDYRYVHAGSGVELIY